MDGTRSILETCAAVRFGRVNADAGAVFYQRLNGCVTDLCRSLPASARAGAMMFLMEYAGLRVGEPLDFFNNYHPPAWSVLYWLAFAPGSPVSLSGADGDAAVCGHAMAMLLHSLDDHLADGDVPATHLTLLVRGEMWRRMNECIEAFAAAVTGGPEVAEGLIDAYYSGMAETGPPISLDRYCGAFRKQMATWTVMPVLAAMRRGDSGFAASLRNAYESFGIAWRLLDDINDLVQDIHCGARSAAHACLDAGGRALWDSLAERGAAGDAAGELYDMIAAQGVIGTLIGRIMRELHDAAATAERIGLAGLAGEFRALSAPLQTGGTGASHA